MTARVIRNDRDDRKISFQLTAPTSGIFDAVDLFPRRQITCRRQRCH